MTARRPDAGDGAIPRLPFPGRRPATPAVPFELRRLSEFRLGVDGVRPHRLDFYGAFLVTRGGGRHAVDFVAHLVAEGGLVFVAPGQVQAVDYAPTSDGYGIFFAADFLAVSADGQRLLDTLPFWRIGAPAVVQVPMEALLPLVSVAEELASEFGADLPGREELLRAHLAVFLLRAARLVPAAGAVAQTPSLVGAFIELVERRFTEDRGVAAYAEALAVSPGHLSRVVRRALGRSAGAVIRDRAMLEAKRLLAYGEHTVAEVAVELGYEDPAYFARHFRRTTGRSPGVFRATMRESSKGSPDPSLPPAPDRS